MSKVDRAIHGPGWGEVILGALLSLVLGVVVGAVLLILKPVVPVKEMPKEPIAGSVYYLEGSRDTSKAKQVLAKRKAFVAGQSVKVTEDELNALTASATAPAPAKPGDKTPPPPPANSGGVVSAGTPNVRIHDGTMQVGVPVTLNVFGFEQRIVAQARGGFEKHGDIFAYEPSEMYLGSCPIQRLPFLNGYIRSKVLASQPVPEDIAAAWPKLANVTIEGNTLNLAMQ